MAHLTASEAPPQTGSATLRSRPLVALLSAEVISSLGSQGSPARMSIVLAVELLPVALFGVPRRFSRR